MSDVTQVIYPNLTGATASFQVPFPYLEAGDVYVYQLSGLDAFEGSSPVPHEDYAFASASLLTFDMAPASGVVILRRVTGDDFPHFATGTISSARLNLAFTKALYLIQEERTVREDLASRAVLAPFGEVGLVLPPADDRRGGKILGFNDATGAIEVQDPDFISIPGPAGGVAGTLAQLKATPVTNVSTIYNGSPFTWKLGDWTNAQASSPNDYVKADGILISVGAWVRQGIEDLKGGTGLLLGTVDARLQVTTDVAKPNVRGVSVDHYGAGAGNWAVDIHGRDICYGLLALHMYSSRNGDVAGSVAAKFDHTRHGSILALSNARNQVTSPGTTGTADFLVLAGFPDTSVSLATNPVVLTQWTYQNVLLTPQLDWPLTITGSGLVVNCLYNSPRGLMVNQGAVGIYTSIMTGQDYGLAVTTSLDGGQTLTVTKNGTGNGAAVVIKNEGVDPSIIGYTGITQGFAIYRNGDYYRGSTKILGAQQAAITNATAASAIATAPTMVQFNALVTDFNALVTKFNTLLNAQRNHGLIAS